MATASCPYCTWRSSEPPLDEAPELLHVAMQLQEHLIDAHWVEEVEATEIADLWAAVAASHAEA